LLVLAFVIFYSSSSTSSDVCEDPIIHSQPSLTVDFKNLDFFYKLDLFYAPKSDSTDKLVAEMKHYVNLTRFTSQQELEKGLKDKFNSGKNINTFSLLGIYFESIDFSTGNIKVKYYMPSDPIDLV